MKRFILAALAALLVLPVSAQRTLKEIGQASTFGGYGIIQYKASDARNNGADDTGFDLRLIRLYVNGSMFKDWKYRVQFQVNGTPRIVDCYVEWNRWKWFQFRLGQQKRAFTFENPMNPFDIGFGSYSQAVTKLAGFSDRVGEQASNGRDIGILFRGDLFPNKEGGFSYLHYEAGIYNGNGINIKDNNHHRDFIGNVQVNPIKGLTLAVFGWEGRYTHATAGDLARHRMAYSARYVTSDYEFRGEYISSVGGRPGAIDENKADGWYVMAGAPLGKNLRVQAKWDVYRQDKTHASQQTNWCLTLDYWWAKNLKAQLNYAFVDKQHDLSALDHHYNTFDLQFYFRF